MNENELQMYRKDLDAYLQGGTGTQSFVGQPYNGIASNCYQANLGANAKRLFESHFHTFDRTASSGGPVQDQMPAQILGTHRSEQDE